MQEAQVTIEGERFPLEPPFLVIATQNPIELEGTYPLPEAQLDRFLMRLGVGYPDPADEVEILARRRRRREDAISVAPVISRADLLAMQASLEDVHVAGVTERYIVDLVQATRADHRVALGASPRGTLALLKLARALAAAPPAGLRAARRREGHGGSGARAPADPQTRAVGIARLGEPGRRWPARARCPRRAPRRDDGTPHPARPVAPRRGGRGRSRSASSPARPELFVVALPILIALATLAARLRAPATP